MGSIQRHIEELIDLVYRDTLVFLSAFLSFLLTALVFLHIYYTLDTSPALIWPPVGMALALMIFAGYRMWLPIFLGQCIAMVLISPSGFLIPALVSGGLAIQSIIGLYVLKQFKFEPDLAKVRNMLIFICVGLTITCIAPLVSTLGQTLSGTLQIDPLFNIFRGWGGGVFSILVIAPVLLMWYPFRTAYFPTVWKDGIEILAAISLLAISNYFVFWTALPRLLGIIVIFILPAVLIWFALRLHPRWLVCAIFLTAIQSISGAIIANPSGNELSEQLVSVEIYVAMIAAIFYVFVTVVEERRQAFLKLREAYTITASSDKNKNEFIAILAHELRNPLAPVISSLELMQSQEADEKKRHIMSSTLNQAAMMRRLLDDLLDIARLEQRKIELHKETVSLNDVVRQALPSVHEKAKHLGHTVSVTLPEDDFFLYVDPVRIKQIIINLLNNALKYTHEGGKIELVCSRINKTLMIKVSDTGIGIPKEKLSHIFEPFKQLGAASRYSSGLGIGLFLTKQLVELHGGTITVQSLGHKKGSTFTVEIPIATASVQQKSASENLTPLQPAHHNVSLPLRILVVDDNKAAADILCKLLQLHKYEAAVAYSGEEALLKAASFLPEAILLDIGMPQMDGYATAKALRALPWNGLIIALSGYGQESDKQQSAAAGFDDHLIKPVGIDEIVAALLKNAKRLSESSDNQDSGG